MPEQGDELRPDIETFECAGCRVALVNAAEILAAARVERVELVHSGTFPAPVRQVRYSVGAEVPDGQPAYLLEAEITTGAGGGLPPDWLNTVVLGPDPLGVLLTRRVAAGDPWATRIVDGVGLILRSCCRSWSG
jgi:transitional endoplasmic reticulum ATPase